MVGVAPRLSLFSLYMDRSLCVSAGVLVVDADPVVLLVFVVGRVATAINTQIHRSKSKHHTNLLSRNLEGAL